jgi:hypothetical protein
MVSSARWRAGAAGASVGRLLWGGAASRGSGRRVRGGRRLGEVVVGTDRQPDELVDLFGAGGQHDDVGVAEGPHLPAGLDAVHPGQHQVEDDHLGLEGLGQLDRLLAVAGGLDLEAVAFKVAGDQADQRRLVVDHQRT